MVSEISAKIQILQGNMNFGLSWLTLTSLEISMDFSKGLQSLEISGKKILAGKINGKEMRK